MKSLMFTILSFLSITANAQTIASDTGTDLIIDIPMMGNVKLNNCDEKLMQAFRMITIMKVINRSKEMQFIINDAQEEIFIVVSETLLEEKEVDEFL
jgi:hypothetical protein